MKRIYDVVGFTGLAIMIALLGVILHHKTRRAPPPPIAIEDSEGTVYLWTGAYPRAVRQVGFALEPGAIV